MKLYGHPLSPFSRFVELTLAINKQDAEFYHLKLLQGEQMSEWFLKLNPKHKVPTLVDGDDVVTESNVIAQYVCNKAGDSGLYPSNAEKRAKIEELLEELSAINFLFIPLTRIFGVPEKHGENQKFVDSIQKFATSRLTKPGFLLGELSLADLLLAVWTNQIESVDPEFNIAMVCPEMAAHLSLIRENVPEWEAIEQRMVKFIQSDTYKTVKSKNARKTQF